MTTTTLVVGVGYLGRRFCALPGRHALGLSRPEFDLDRDGAVPLELPREYDVLYTVPPARQSRENSRLERLLDQLTSPPGRFVYISTTGVYGDHRGASVDEDTPVSPGSGSAALRVADENALREWGYRAGVEIVILRVPGIYGPGRLGVERLREQTPVVREDDLGPGNRIHVDDLAACCAAALDRKTPPGIYNVGDGDHRTSTAFSKEVARQASLPAPPEITIEEAEQQFSEMRLSFLRNQRRVDTTKMREVLGVIPRYSDPAEGISASLHG